MSLFHSSSSFQNLPFHSSKSFFSCFLCFLESLMDIVF
jgi:hypothetical protein